MVQPNYVCNNSLMNKVVKINGNIELATTLENLVKNEYINQVDLYEAQNKIKEYCIENYGIDFYEKNIEAINFIVENEYCIVEREKNYLFDHERYDYDIKHGVLY